MASCGVRDVIKFLVKNRMVDCIVATAGGIEEDFIKCLAPTYIGKEMVKYRLKSGRSRSRRRHNLTMKKVQL